MLFHFVRSHGVNVLSIFLAVSLSGCKSESTPSASPAAPTAGTPEAPAASTPVAGTPAPSPSASASASFSSVVGLYSASDYCRALSGAPVAGYAITVPATALFGSSLFEGKAVELKSDGSFAYFTAVFSDVNCAHLVVKYHDDQTGTFEDTIGALDAGATDQRVVKFTVQGASAVYLKVVQNADLSLKLPSPQEAIASGTSASAPHTSDAPWTYKKIASDSDHRTADVNSVKNILASDSMDYLVPCMRTKSFPYASGKRYGFESAVRFYVNGNFTQDSYFRDTLFNTIEVCLYIGGESDRAQRNLMSGSYSIEALGAVPSSNLYAGLMKIVVSEGKFGLTNNSSASEYVAQLNLSNTCGSTSWSTTPNTNPKLCHLGLIGSEGSTRTDTYLFTFDVITKALKISKFNTFTFAEYTSASGSTPASSGFKIIDDATLSQP